MLRKLHTASTFETSSLDIQSNPATSNTTGKQKLVQYIVGVRCIRMFIKANQIKGKWKTVRYSGNSLYPCSI